MALDASLEQEKQTSYQEVEAFIFTKKGMMAKIELLFLLENILMNLFGNETERDQFKLSIVPKELIEAATNSKILDALLAYYSQYQVVDKSMESLLTSFPDSNNGEAAEKRLDLIEMYRSSPLKAVATFQKILRDCVAEGLTAEGVDLIEVGATPEGFSKGAIDEEMKSLPTPESLGFNAEEQIDNALSSDINDERKIGFTILFTLAGERYSANKIKDKVYKYLAADKLSIEEQKLVIELIEVWAPKDWADINIFTDLLTGFLLTGNEEVLKKAVLAFIGLDDDSFHYEYSMNYKDNPKAHIIPGRVLEIIMDNRDELFNSMDKLTKIKLHRKLTELGAEDPLDASREISKLDLSIDERAGLIRESGWAENNINLILNVLSEIFENDDDKWNSEKACDILIKTEEGRKEILRYLKKSHPIDQKERYLDLLDKLIKFPDSKEDAVALLNELPLSYFESLGIFYHLSSYLTKLLLEYHGSPEKISIMKKCIQEIKPGSGVGKAFESYQEQVKLIKDAAKRSDEDMLGKNIMTLFNFIKKRDKLNNEDVEAFLMELKSILFSRGYNDLDNVETLKGSSQLDNDLLALYKTLEGINERRQVQEEDIEQINADFMNILSNYNIDLEPIFGPRAPKINIRQVVEAMGGLNPLLQLTDIIDEFKKNGSVSEISKKYTFFNDVFRKEWPEIFNKMYGDLKLHNLSYSNKMNCTQVNFITGKILELFFEEDTFNKLVTIQLEPITHFMKAIKHNDKLLTIDFYEQLLLVNYLSGACLDYSSLKQDVYGPSSAPFGFETTYNELIILKEKGIDNLICLRGLAQAASESFDIENNQTYLKLSEEFLDKAFSLGKEYFPPEEYCLAKGLNCLREIKLPNNSVNKDFIENKIEETLQFIDKALEHNAKYAPALYKKGILLDILGKKEEGIKCINEAKNIADKELGNLPIRPEELRNMIEKSQLQPDSMDISSEEIDSSKKEGTETVKKKSSKTKIISAILALGSGLGAAIVLKFKAFMGWISSFPSSIFTPGNGSLAPPAPTLHLVNGTIIHIKASINAIIPKLLQMTQMGHQFSAVLSIYIPANHIAISIVSWITQISGFFPMSSIVISVVIITAIIIAGLIGMAGKRTKESSYAKFVESKKERAPEKESVILTPAEKRNKAEIKKLLSECDSTLSYLWRNGQMINGSREKPHNYIKSLIRRAKVKNFKAVEIYAQPLFGLNRKTFKNNTDWKESLISHFSDLYEYDRKAKVNIRKVANENDFKTRIVMHAPFYEVIENGIMRYPEPSKDMDLFEAWLKLAKQFGSDLITLHLEDIDENALKGVADFVRKAARVKIKVGIENANFLSGRSQNNLGSDELGLMHNYAEFTYAINTIRQQLSVSDSKYFGVCFDIEKAYNSFDSETNSMTTDIFKYFEKVNETEIPIFNIHVAQFDEETGQKIRIDKKGPIPVKDFLKFIPPGTLVNQETRDYVIYPEDKSETNVKPTAKKTEQKIEKKASNRGILPVILIILTGIGALIACIKMLSAKLSSLFSLKVFTGDLGVKPPTAPVSLRMMQGNIFSTVLPGHFRGGLRSISSYPKIISNLINSNNLNLTESAHQLAGGAIFHSGFLTQSILPNMHNLAQIIQPYIGLALTIPSVSTAAAVIIIAAIVIAALIVMAEIKRKNVSAKQQDITVFPGLDDDTKREIFRNQSIFAITEGCSHRCKHCFYASRWKFTKGVKSLPFPIILALLDEAKRLGIETLGNKTTYNSIRNYEFGDVFDYSYYDPVSGIDYDYTDVIKAILERFPKQNIMIVTRGWDSKRGEMTGRKFVELYKKYFYSHHNINLAFSIDLYEINNDLQEKQYIKHMGHILKMFQGYYPGIQVAYDSENEKHTRDVIDKIIDCAAEVDSNDSESKPEDSGESRRPFLTNQHILRQMVNAGRVSVLLEDGSINQAIKGGLKFDINNSTDGYYIEFDGTIKKREKPVVDIFWNKNNQTLGKDDNIFENNNPLVTLPFNAWDKNNQLSENISESNNEELNSSLAEDEVFEEESSENYVNNEGNLNRKNLFTSLGAFIDTINIFSNKASGTKARREAILILSLFSRAVGKLHFTSKEFLERLQIFLAKRITLLEKMGKQGKKYITKLAKALGLGIYYSKQTFLGRTEKIFKDYLNSINISVNARLIYDIYLFSMSSSLCKAAPVEKEIFAGVINGEQEMIDKLEEIHSGLLDKDAVDKVLADSKTEQTASEVNELISYGADEAFKILDPSPDFALIYHILFNYKFWEGKSDFLMMGFVKKPRNAGIERRPLRLIPSELKPAKTPPETKISVKAADNNLEDKKRIFLSGPELLKYFDVNGQRFERKLRAYYRIPLTRLENNKNMKEVEIDKIYKIGFDEEGKVFIINSQNNAKLELSGKMINNHYISRRFELKAENLRFLARLLGYERELECNKKFKELELKEKEESTVIVKNKPTILKDDDQINREEPIPLSKAEENFKKNLKDQLFMWLRDFGIMLEIEKEAKNTVKSGWAADYTKNLSEKTYIAKLDIKTNVQLSALKKYSDLGLKAYAVGWLGNKDFNGLKLLGYINLSVDEDKELLAGIYGNNPEAGEVPQLYINISLSDQIKGSASEQYVKKLIENNSLASELYNKCFWRLMLELKEGILLKKAKSQGFTQVAEVEPEIIEDDGRWYLYSGEPLTGNSEICFSEKKNDPKEFLTELDEAWEFKKIIEGNRIEKKPGIKYMPENVQVSEQINVASTGTKMPGDVSSVVQFAGQTSRIFDTLILSASLPWNNEEDRQDIFDDCFIDLNKYIASLARLKKQEFAKDLKEQEDKYEGNDGFSREYLENYIKDREGLLEKIYQYLAKTESRNVKAYTYIRGKKAFLNGIKYSQCEQMVKDINKLGKSVVLNVGRIKKNTGGSYYKTIAEFKPWLKVFDGISLDAEGVSDESELCNVLEMLKTLNDTVSMEIRKEKDKNIRKIIYINFGQDQNISRRVKNIILADGFRAVFQNDPGAVLNNKNCEKNISSVRVADILRLKKEGIAVYLKDLFEKGIYGINFIFCSRKDCARIDRVSYAEGRGQLSLFEKVLDVLKGLLLEYKGFTAERAYEKGYNHGIDLANEISRSRRNVPKALQ